MESRHSFNTLGTRQNGCLLFIMNIYIYMYEYERVYHTHLHPYTCIHTYTYVFVVNFDALAQAGDIWIERRQVVFLCWMQDSNPRSQTANRQQTECPLTNWLSYRGSSYKTWQPVPDQRAFIPLDPTVRLWRYTCWLLLISMLRHR